MAGEVLAMRATSRPPIVQAHDFLEGRTRMGFIFDMSIMVLIMINVACFVFSDPTTDTLCPDNDKACKDQAKLAFDIVEYVSLVVFIVEYGARVWAIGAVTPGLVGRLRYVALNPFSWVDLAAIIPSLVELGFDIASLMFIRVLRLLRVFRAEGRYVESITLFDDVFRNNKHLFMTSGFAGAVVWLVMACFNYICERDNPSGRYDNLLESMWFTILNLTGEFPGYDELSTCGKATGVATMTLAVGVFAIPTGILGAGFMDLVEERRQEGQPAQDEDREEPLVKAETKMNDSANDDFSPALAKQVPMPSTHEATPEAADLVLPEFCVSCSHTMSAESGLRAIIHHFLSARARFGKFFEMVIGVVIVLNVIVFSMQTMDKFDPKKDAPPALTIAFWIFELCSVLLFTAEYAMRVWSAPEDPEFNHKVKVLYSKAGMAHSQSFWDGTKARLRFMLSFYGVIDLASILPFYIDLVWSISTWSDPTDGHIASTTFLRALRLLRLIKMDNYIGALSLFDDVFKANKDILVSLSFIGLVMWILFSTLMWLAMRPTQNLPAEPGQPVYSIIEACCPEGWNYTRCLTLDDWDQSRWNTSQNNETNWPTTLIAVTQCDYYSVPSSMWFTLLNLCGEFPAGDYTALAKVIATFIAIFAIGVFAIPTGLLASSFEDLINQRQEAVEQWVRSQPRCQRCQNVLASPRDASRWTVITATGFVAAVCVIVFSTLLVYAEENDQTDDLGNGVTMADRYSSVPNALFYTYLHLTGDYPLSHYNTWGRIVNFFMIIIAVGLVGIPSGIIASMFEDSIRKERQAGAGADNDDSKDAEPEDGECTPLLQDEDFYCRMCRVSRAKAKGLTATLHSFLITDIPSGRIFEYCTMGLILLNLVVVILDTLNDSLDTLWDVIEYFCLGAFTIECVPPSCQPVAFSFPADLPRYIVRMAAAGEDPENRGGWLASHLPQWAASRLYYAVSFFAIVDLVSILPSYVVIIINLVKKASNQATWSIILRTLRVLRLLKFEHYIEAFTIMVCFDCYFVWAQDNVIRRQARVLAWTTAIALGIWAAFAGVLLLTDELIDPQDPKYDPATYSFPGNFLLSMCWTSCFLGGEWAFIEFSVLGKIISAIMAIAGLAIFAVPAGIFFSGFEDILTTRQEEMEAKKDMLLQCKQCDKVITNFVWRRLPNE
eukprot:gene7290-1303_t